MSGQHPERWVSRSVGQSLPTAAEWNAFVRELAEQAPRQLEDSERLNQLVDDIEELKRQGRWLLAVEEDE